MERQRGPIATTAPKIRLPPENYDAKSRLIIQGFRDPDIAALSRVVPTPSTSDVPLALRRLSPVKAKARDADIKSAFARGPRHPREGPLFASPPAGGVSGEDPNELTVVELLTEARGLVTGPPGWRRSLLTAFKECGFKRHPLAPAPW